MSESVDDRDAARARLAFVRERFASRLAARVTELQEQVARAKKTERSWAEPIALAHRLAGTAGSYGYVDAGAHAAAVEDALRRIESGETPWDELDAALQRLRDATSSAPA